MHIKKYIDIISHMELFNMFSNEELSTFFHVTLCRISKHKKDEILYFQNERCSTMDIILEGELFVQKIDEKGSVLTLSSFAAPNTIGGNLLFSSKNIYPMTISCRSNTIILHIKKELIIKLCQKHELFLVNFLKSTSDKALILTDKINSISLKTIRERIIDFLIYEYYRQNSLVIELNISKKALAERFGIRRPSLSRELNKMRKDKLIDFNAKTITIKDFKLLNNL
ncbi:Crp/Fnr family transcriptional regulator [Clostridiisalibacter paucivorans]|uniref:Crp/Fnr family transcriptional regulator n=1 Tax=Clostridiisalibacter paucivorans TaxID=408753 RepID=UPI00047C9A58|nr:Crp/Fnr family transcriptional regulator [Clostridiisalibacter paucivorans]